MNFHEIWGIGKKSYINYGRSGLELRLVPLDGNDSVPEACAIISSAVWLEFEKCGASVYPLLWRRAVMVTALRVSTKLLYVGPG